MREENNFLVRFTEEFNVCLDNIQEFFSEQGAEVLRWWYQKEDEIIQYIVDHLSVNPYIGIKVQQGQFKDLRQITYGKSKHRMLSYVIFYAVHENKKLVDVINILPSRSKRDRIK